jgi:hypothetical protein
MNPVAICTSAPLSQTRVAFFLMYQLKKTAPNDDTEELLKESDCPQ